MERLRRNLKIQLMSDMCAGSGYSYGGVIDSDIAYDEYGLPQIPARRLKGCMREAAELVCPETAEALFGKTGDREVKGLVIGNAYIEDYDVIADELGKLRKTKQAEAFCLSPQNILNMYTGVRAQTKICEGTGVAEENTLRFTRVVGQYDPGKDRAPLCFLAEVEYDKVCDEQMKRIVKAVRNLGMNRNRGLGSVRCTLTDICEAGARARTHSEMESRAQDGGKVCLTYVLRSREPLLMSSDNTGVSDSFISGRSILGTLAAAYLRREGTSGDSEEFRALFLDGSTIFTDANLTFPPETGGEDGRKWPGYYPAPLYLNRLKKTKALVNLLAGDSDLPGGRDKETEGGNLPKKLKTHYVHEAAPNTYDIAEPEREIYYHNSRRELLYSQEALKEGQYFRGKIYAEERYAGLLKELLEGSRLAFGKSKTAQYGACKLAADIAVEPAGGETFSGEAGERIGVVFCSDGIFAGGAGEYTVKFEEIKELTGARLGIPYDKSIDDGSMVQTKEITGYNSTWNLRRPGIPAVKAGSVLVYTIRDGERWRKKLGAHELFVGERNLEGCGQVRIVNCRDMAYRSYYVGEQSAPEEGSSEKELVLDRCRPFLVKLLTGQLLERLVFLYTRKRAKLRLTAATVGRLDLMLRESLGEHGADPECAFKDFCLRVQSIKRKKEQEEAFRLLRQVLLKDGRGEDNSYKLDLEKMTEVYGDGELKKTAGLLKKYSTEEEYRRRLSGIWGVYMENILTYHKYLKKHEGGRENE